MNGFSGQIFYYAGLLAERVLREDRVPKYSFQNSEMDTED